jgi:hypothetical protein
MSKNFFFFGILGLFLGIFPFLLSSESVELPSLLVLNSLTSGVYVSAKSYKKFGSSLKFFVCSE